MITLKGLVYLNFYLKTDQARRLYLLLIITYVYTRECIPNHVFVCVY